MRGDKESGKVRVGDSLARRAGGRRMRESSRKEGENYGPGAHDRHVGSDYLESQICRSREGNIGGSTKRGGTNTS